MGCDRRSWGDAIGRGARLRPWRLLVVRREFFFVIHSASASASVWSSPRPFPRSFRLAGSHTRGRGGGASGGGASASRNADSYRMRRFAFRLSLPPTYPSASPLRRRRRRSERRERRVFDRIARFPRVIRVCRVHARVPQSMKRHRARVAQRRRGGERASPRRRGRTHRSNRRVLLVRCGGGVDASVQRPEKHAKHASTASVCSTLLLGITLLLSRLVAHGSADDAAPPAADGRVRVGVREFQVHRRRQTRSLARHLHAPDESRDGRAAREISHVHIRQIERVRFAPGGVGASPREMIGVPGRAPELHETPVTNVKITIDVTIRRERGRVAHSEAHRDALRDGLRRGDDFHRRARGLRVAVDEMIGGSRDVVVDVRTLVLDVQTHARVAREVTSAYEVRAEGGTRFFRGRACVFLARARRARWVWFVRVRRVPREVWWVWFVPFEERAAEDEDGAADELHARGGGADVAGVVAIARVRGGAEDTTEGGVQRGGNAGRVEGRHGRRRVEVEGGGGRRGEAPHAEKTPSRGGDARRRRPRGGGARSGREARPNTTGPPAPPPGGRRLPLLARGVRRLRDGRGTRGVGDVLRALPLARVARPAEREQTRRHRTPPPRGERARGRRDATRVVLTRPSTRRARAVPEPGVRRHDVARRARTTSDSTSRRDSIPTVIVVYKKCAARASHPGSPRACAAQRSSPKNSCVSPHTLLSRRLLLQLFSSSSSRVHRGIVQRAAHGRLVMSAVDSNRLAAGAVP